VLFGGRIAEELFMNQMTTGASNDFKRATEMARRMVTEWGMSDALGTMVYGENEGEVFLGRSVTTHQNMSEDTMRAVDKEVRSIIDGQYALARRLLEENRDKVEIMTKALLEWETLDAHQIDDIMNDRPPRPPKPVAAKPVPPPSENESSVTFTMPSTKGKGVATGHPFLTVFAACAFRRSPPAPGWAQLRGCLHPLAAWSAWPPPASAGAADGRT